MAVAAVDLGKLQGEAAAPAAALLLIPKANQAAHRINQINHRVVKVLVIEVELVSIAHLEVTYGVVAVVAQAALAATLGLSLDHHKVHQEE
jgi:hypothetical protein